jgi:hypothetical protein
MDDSLRYADPFEIIPASDQGVQVFFSFRRAARVQQTVQRAQVQDLAARAAQLEEAAERFKREGNEKLAASFAAQAAEMRRAGA